MQVMGPTRIGAMFRHGVGLGHFGLGDRDRAAKTSANCRVLFNFANTLAFITRFETMANVKSLSDLNGEGDDDKQSKHNDYYAGGEKR